MTVVSYLRLSRKSVMGSADERETHDLGGTQRTYDVTKKITRLNDMPIFVGSAGSVSNAQKVFENATDDLKDPTDYGKVLDVLKKSYREAWRTDFSDAVLAQYGVTWDEFKTGNLDPDIKKTIRESLDRAQNAFGVRMLVGGYDKSRDESRIHEIVFPGRAHYYKTEDSIGTGFDIADISIGNAIANIDPESRDNIELYQGARILMEAAQAAWRNTGVGGRTQLIWVDRENYHELGVKESNMLNAALFCERREALTRQDVTSLFKRILNDQAKYDEILRELSDKIPNDKLVELFWTKGLHF